MPKLSAHPFLNRHGRGHLSRGALLLGLLLLGQDAAAQDGRDRCLRDPACRQLSERAQGEYRDQRYYNAWRLLKDAYAASQEPRLLVNLGRCLEKLGLIKDAVAAYERFLAEDTVRDPAERERVQKYLQQARAAPSPSFDAPPAPAAPTGPASQPPAPSESPPPEVEPAPRALLPVAPVSPAEAAPATVAAPAPRRAWSRSPWLWLGVGAGVASLAIGLGVGLGLAQSPRYYRVEW